MIIVRTRDLAFDLSASCSKTRVELSTFLYYQPRRDRVTDRQTESNA